ncbi:MAG: hypothetical protein V4573_11830, partial [Pseudomonadota bacterium]
MKTKKRFRWTLLHKSNSEVSTANLFTLCLPSEPERRKDLEACAAKSLIHMVGVKGFEPSTPCTPCKC